MEIIICFLSSNLLIWFITFIDLHTLKIPCCAVLYLVTQSCPTFCDHMNCSPPGSSVHRDSPGKNTGVRCHALFQGIFRTQGWNLGLLYCRQALLSEPAPAVLAPPILPSPCCGASTISPAAMPEATTLAVGNSKASVTLKARAAAEGTGNMSGRGVRGCKGLVLQSMRPLR